MLRMSKASSKVDDKHDNIDILSQCITGYKIIPVVGNGPNLET